jgi:hypothetical protein
MVFFARGTIGTIEREEEPRQIKPTIRAFRPATREEISVFQRFQGLAPTEAEIQRALAEERERIGLGKATTPEETALAQAKQALADWNRGTGPKDFRVFNRLQRDIAEAQTNLARAKEKRIAEARAAAEKERIAEQEKLAEEQRQERIKVFRTAQGERFIVAPGATGPTRFFEGSETFGEILGTTEPTFEQIVTGRTAEAEAERREQFVKLFRAPRVPPTEEEAEAAFRIAFPEVKPVEPFTLRPLVEVKREPITREVIPKETPRERRIREEIEARGVPIFPGEKIDLEERILLLGLKVGEAFKPEVLSGDVLPSGLAFPKPEGAPPTPFSFIRRTVPGFATVERGFIQRGAGETAITGLFSTAFALEQGFKRALGETKRTARGEEPTEFFSLIPSAEKTLFETKASFKESAEEFKALPTGEQVGFAAFTLATLGLPILKAARGKVVGGQFGGKVPAIAVEQAQVGTTKAVSIGVETGKPGFTKFRPGVTIATGTGETPLLLGAPRTPSVSFFKPPRIVPEKVIPARGFAPRTPLETAIIERAFPEEAGKIGFGRGVREQTVEAGLTVKELKPQIEEVLESQGIPKAGAVSKGIIGVIKREKGTVKGSVVQKAVGEEFGVVTLTRVPRDIDAVFPKAQKIPAINKALEKSINKNAGEKVVELRDGKLTVIKTGEKLFDVLAESEAGLGPTLGFGEEFIGLGLKPEKVVKTREGVRIITPSEQASRKLVGGVGTVFRSPLEIKTPSGQIARGFIRPEKAGRIKDIGDFALIEEAGVRGLRLRGRERQALIAEEQLARFRQQFGEDIFKAGEEAKPIKTTLFSTSPSRISFGRSVSPIKGIGAVSSIGLISPSRAKQISSSFKGKSVAPSKITPLSKSSGAISPGKSSLISPSKSSFSKSTSPSAFPSKIVSPGVSQLISITPSKVVKPSPSKAPGVTPTRPPTGVPSGFIGVPKVKKIKPSVKAQSFKATFLGKRGSQRVGKNRFSTRKEARRIASYIVDISPDIGFKISKSKDAPTKAQFSPAIVPFGQRRGKFEKKGNFFVEKKKHRTDSFGERTRGQIRVISGAAFKLGKGKPVRLLSKKFKGFRG